MNPDLYKLLVTLSRIGQISALMSQALLATEQAARNEPEKVEQNAEKIKAIHQGLVRLFNDYLVATDSGSDSNSGRTA